MKVLLKQQKSSIKPPFDPEPYTVTEVKGTQVTARRGGKERKRNKVKMKVVKERPVHLQLRASMGMEEEEEDTDSELDIQLAPTEAEQRQEPVQAEEVPVGGEEEQQQVEEAGPRRSGRLRKPPARFGKTHQEQERQERQGQLSPRERKRIKGLAARKVPREEWMIRHEGEWRKYRKESE